MKSNINLYLNADRSKVVTADDPEAASLLVNAGREIPDGEIVALGEGLLSQARALSKSSDETEEKAVSAAPEDKAVKTPAENKAAKE